MVDRAHGAPSPNHPLLEAARYNDAQAEELGLHETLKRLGLRTEDVRYVAEQRALRVVLMDFGRLEETNPDRPVTIRVSHEERARINQLIPVYMDGIALGWRAERLNDRLE